LSQLPDAVERGETIVITRPGRAVEAIRARIDEGVGVSLLAAP
jgi:antitoxin (DNA-binding transcriptional repressor) of toxin-antitoxin stability system